MRYFLMGVILVLCTATPVRAVNDLTSAVNARWGQRYVPGVAQRPPAGFVGIAPRPRR